MVTLPVSIEMIYWIISREHETFDLYSVQSMSVDSAPKHILLAEHPAPASVGK